MGKRAGRVRLPLDGRQIRPSQPLCRSGHLALKIRVFLLSLLWLQLGCRLGHRLGCSRQLTANSSAKCTSGPRSEFGRAKLAEPITVGTVGTCRYQSWPNFAPWVYGRDHVEETRGVQATAGHTTEPACLKPTPLGGLPCSHDPDRPKEGIHSSVVSALTRAGPRHRG